jgi:nucleotide-binding universal stress UspA family protein
MYSKILVPLDGSKLAECVLDHVDTIASGCGTQEVILVSVTEGIKVKQNVRKSDGEARGFRILQDNGMGGSGQVGVTSGDTLIGELPLEGASWTRVIGKQFNEADKYLDKIQRRLIKKGINARTEVLTSNNVSEAIVDYAEKAGADLILMASHGRTGISRWASGSVADKVFRGTCIPILMVRAPGCTATA